MPDTIILSVHGVCRNAFYDGIQKINHTGFLCFYPVFLISLLSDCCAETVLWAAVK